MTKDLIRYDLLVQDALKNVVRKVLGDAAREGLPGEHHFYVSFRTDFPGVRLSTRMREKYPQDMTIVLQHQFWDLSVSEYAIEVGLSFSGVPERLLIPFDALTGFFDPSVQFGLKFEIQPPPAEEDGSDGAGHVEAFPSASDNAAPAREDARARAPRGAGSEPDVQQPTPSPAAAAKTGAAKPAKSKKTKPEDDSGSEGESDRKAAAPGAEVVSLDSFRKKS